MEALSAYMREKHDFMAAKMKEGKTPNPAQLMKFLADVCAGCGPLVQADGVADTVATDLRNGFASVCWDVKTNRPDPSAKAPPTPEKVLSFLSKASAKFAPPKPAPAPAPVAVAKAKTGPKKPQKLALEVSVAAAGEAAAGEDDDDGGGLQFGAPEPTATTPAAQEAKEAQEARAAKLTPTASAGGGTIIALDSCICLVHVTSVTSRLTQLALSPQARATRSSRSGWLTSRRAPALRL